MNNFAINNLANMEFMLYGGRSGANMNCPSMYNGYMAAANNMMNNYNPIFRGYYNSSNYNNYSNKDIFTYQNDGTKVNNPYKMAAEGSSQVDGNNPQFKGEITQDDMNKLADYYAKNNALEEGFMGAAAGGLSWMAFEHAQSIFHPFNAWNGAKKASEIFSNIPKEFAKENAALLEHAHFSVQQAVRDTGKKYFWSGWLRQQIGKKNPADKEAIDKLVQEMKTAVARKDVKAIAEATERLQAARGMDGKIAGLITGRKSVAERLTKKADSIQKGKENLLNMNKSVIANDFVGLAKSAFKKDFMGFMLFETVFNIGKISTAFQKDNETGIKQMGQSLGKSALGTAGWCLGRAAGTLLAAKAGATLGLGAGPVGAVVGALIGFTVGSIGMWAGHKLGNAVLGHDVADKVEAQNMTKTKEGQMELIKFAAEKAQEGKTDPKTNQIVYKAFNALA